MDCWRYRIAGDVNGAKTVKSVVLGTVVCCVSCLVVSNPVDCDLCPWNSPGKNTGVNYYSLLQGSSQPKDGTQVSHIAGRFFTTEPPGKTPGHSLLHW